MDIDSYHVEIITEGNIYTLLMVKLIILSQSSRILIAYPRKTIIGDLYQVAELF